MDKKLSSGRPALVVFSDQVVRVRLLFLTGRETQVDISAGEPARALASMCKAAARALLWQTAELEGADEYSDACMLHKHAALVEQLQSTFVLKNCTSTIKLMWQTLALDSGTAESLFPQLSQAAWEDRVVNIIVCAFHDTAFLHRMFHLWAQHAMIYPPDLVDSSESGEE